MEAITKPILGAAIEIRVWNKLVQFTFQGWRS
jgi:hypothetical protein